MASQDKRPTKGNPTQGILGNVIGGDSMNSGISLGTVIGNGNTFNISMGAESEVQEEAAPPRKPQAPDRPRWESHGLDFGAIDPNDPKMAATIINQMHAATGAVHSNVKKAHGHLKEMFQHGKDVAEHRQNMLNFKSMGVDSPTPAQSDKADKKEAEVPKPEKKEPETGAKKETEKGAEKKTEKGAEKKENGVMQQVRQALRATAQEGDKAVRAASDQVGRAAGVAPSAPAPAPAPVPVPTQTPATPGLDAKAQAAGNTAAKGRFGADALTGAAGVEVGNRNPGLMVNGRASSLAKFIPRMDVGLDLGAQQEPAQGKQAGLSLGNRAGISSRQLNVPSLDLSAVTNSLRIGKTSVAEAWKGVSATRSSNLGGREAAPSQEREAGRGIV